MVNEREHIKILPYGSEERKELITVLNRIRKAIVNNRFDFKRLSKPNSTYFKHPIKIGCGGVNAKITYIGVYDKIDKKLVAVVLFYEMNPTNLTYAYTTDDKQGWYRMKNSLLTHAAYYHLLEGV